MKKLLSGNVLYIFIFIAICLCTVIYNTIDMDYWARLLQGNAFWQTGHILKSDPFSYTQTHLWIDHEWGSSVVFSLVQNIFGFTGILALRIFIVSVMFLLIFKTAKMISDEKVKTAQRPLSDVILFIFALEAMPTIAQSGMRCHFFTFVFFTLFIYILEYVRKTQKFKYLVFLPLIMLVWGNMHGGCVAGLGLLMIYSAAEFLNKKPFKYYLLALAFTFSMLFINPYGVEYVKFILMASTMERPFVTEWISPFFHPDVTFMLWFKIFYVLSLVLFLLNIKKIKQDYTKYILIFICLFLSFKYVKNTPFIVIVSSIFFYEIFCELCRNRIKKIIIIPLIGLYIISICNKFSPYFLSAQPVKTVEFLKINNLKGKVLAPFDMGSYIAYKLYPNNLIYMDGRYEEVYFKSTKDLLDNFYNVQKDGYKILEGKNKPDYVIAPSNALINDYLLKTNNFKLIYRNENNYLYSSAEKLKDKYILPPDDYKYYLKRAFETGS